MNQIVLSAEGKSVEGELRHSNEEHFERFIEMVILHA